MGCKVYAYYGKAIQFCDDDETACLCTFPHNYESLKSLGPHTVRSLAMLGAAVAMLTTRADAMSDRYWIMLPRDLPEWIRKEIEKNIPCEESE